MPCAVASTSCLVRAAGILHAAAEDYLAQVLLASEEQGLSLTALQTAVSGALGGKMEYQLAL